MDICVVKRLFIFRNRISKLHHFFYIEWINEVTATFVGQKHQEILGTLSSRTRLRRRGVQLKFSGGVTGVVTPSKAPSPTKNFCLYPPAVLRCFWKNPLMTPTPTTPTTPLQASFTATPSPSTTPAPHKNFGHTCGRQAIQMHSASILFEWKSSCLPLRLLELVLLLKVSKIVWIATVHVLFMPRTLQTQVIVLMIL